MAISLRRPFFSTRAENMVHCFLSTIHHEISLYTDHFTIFSGNTTAESFLDQLKRSASTVNPKNRPAPIAKPIRRSKSQRSQNFVTQIQHGGSVTLVSLNGDLDQESSGKPNEIKHVHHHHFVQDWDGNGVHPGGSQTLPNRKSGQFF